MTATPEPAKPPFSEEKLRDLREHPTPMLACSPGYATDLVNCVRDLAAELLYTRLNAPLAGELTEEERTLCEEVRARLKDQRTLWYNMTDGMLKIVDRLTTGATR